MKKLLRILRVIFGFEVQSEGAQQWPNHGRSFGHKSSLVVRRGRGNCGWGGRSLRNSVSGPTNPYDIHDILVKEQRLDPGYSFKFAQAAVVSRLAAPGPRRKRKGRR